MRRRGRIIALEGPSGAGKTTITRVAARAFGWVPLKEAFERLEPPPSLRFRTSKELLSLETSLLAEEARRYRVAVERRRAGQTVVADTGFLGPLTYTAGLVTLGAAPPRVFEQLRSLLERGESSGRIGLPDQIAYLDVPGRARRSRSSRDPRGHPKEFAARHEAVGREERTFYRSLARGPLSGRVHFVSGTGPPETVAERVRAAVASPGGPPSTGATLDDLLARLAERVSPRRAHRRKSLGRHR